ncbi:MULTISPECIES: ankyrin repeat domain-containing protein [unclassified Beijerinckia]|uniref:ankyrin repeat domain-containing protein n=1 Tax=unclassified Beijerinckia TaxID=2638183 RepID=UPI000898A762|nr:MULTISPECIES: ankyrin repeat domain-containing protein [unclassified Beijerinckia]MDH7795918.1 ankyrin repeat protein [Beijerinckia sp. GAS462]SEC22183.1 hypothetical protein SAMN05443249_2197 [Beijerinckia sp. 28-YEA-48]
MRKFLRAWPIIVASLLCGTAQAQIAPNQQELLGYRGLMAAAAQGDIGVISQLAKNPNEREQRDGNGRTPLLVATFRKQREAIKALLAAGANAAALDQQKYDAVTIAAVADDPQTLKILLDGGASAKLITSIYDGTALIAAAHLGHEEIVRQLIAAGAPLDHVNNLGWTALMESIVLGDGGARHQATLRYLLQARASPNIADRQGVRPLAHARQRGYTAMAEMLANAGAR